MNTDTAMNMDIEALRLRIDEADERLLKAFTDRMEAARAIAACKAKSKLPVYDPAREREVIARQLQRVEPYMRGYVERLYDTLFAFSREMQQQAPDNPRH